MQEPDPRRKLTLLKPEGTRRVGEPQLRWLESVEEDQKNIGVRKWTRRTEYSGGQFGRGWGPPMTVMPEGGGGRRRLRPSFEEICRSVIQCSSLTFLYSSLHTSSWALRAALLNIFIRLWNVIFREDDTMVTFRSQAISYVCKRSEHKSVWG
jgi:hypothetical protein